MNTPIRYLFLFFLFWLPGLSVQAGAKIDWSTYLGGSGDDRIHRVRAASGGDWLVVGNTTSPTLAGITPTLIGSDDPSRNDQFGGFIARISGDGQEILWIRRFGRGVVYLTDVIELQGAIYVTGVSTVYGQTALIDPFNGYDKNAPQSIISEYTGSLTTHDAPNTYRSILLQMNADASTLVNGSWMGEATPGREGHGIGDIVGSWYAGSDMWRYMRQREDWNFAAMNPYTINRIEAFPNGDLALLMDGGLRWAGGQDSLYRFQAGNISSTGLVWKKVFDAAGNNSTVSSPEHSSVMSADLVVSEDGDTVYVSGGSNGWTGAEPYWNPFIFKFSAADGSQQWDRTGITGGGPYGCFNAIQSSIEAGAPGVGGLISDSYGQAITLNDDGEPLLSMWCDGGATLLTREPWDITQSVTSQDGDGFWGFRGRTFASVLGHLNQDPTQGWIRSHRVKPNPNTQGQENATLFYGIAPVPGEPGQAWYAGFSRGMTEINAWDAGVGTGTIARVNMDASGTERMVVDRFPGVKEFLTLGHRPDTRSYLAGGYGLSGSPLLNPLQSSVAGSNDGYLVAFSEESATRVEIAPDSLPPQTASWETGFQDRLGVLANAHNPWSIPSGNAGPDDGKKVFTPLLAEMWKVRDDDTALLDLINNTGDSRVRSTHAGSFYKPFSVPPFTHYYKTFEHLIPEAQKDYVRNRVDSSTTWGQLTRFDGYMDPLYNPSLFNSENFNWMARLGGYLWSLEFDDFDLGPRKGMSRAYFQTHLDNLTRALYNTGRVEWNSNNYFGHSFNPILTLYEFAPDEATRRQARALADWMVLEAALHYIDGFQAAADVRAKTNAYLPFTGGVWPFTYLYFIDDGFHPTYDTASVQSNIRPDYVGIVHWSSYRPPQIAIDIAQRKYALPVEIQSAKPFYYLDHDNYQDWAGDTEKSRRFEFETIYHDENLILASLATSRPDRNASIPSQSGFFTEQNLWRLGVKGSNNGALQITGNSGSGSNTAGRHPYEQIGQYGNVMMRVVKGSNQLWIVTPDERPAETGPGGTLFIDMGHGVYAAFLPYNSTGYASSAYTQSGYTQHRWNFNSSEFGGLVLEVGTQRDYGDYANFKSTITNSSSLQSPATDQLSYTSPLGHELRMEFQPVSTMLLNPGQVDQNGNPLAERNWNPAGTLPRTWRDGVEVDYESWNTYQTVQGEEIVHQEWGSGTLRMVADGEAIEIAVDPATAEVTYFSAPLANDQATVGIEAIDADGDESGSDDLSFRIYLDSAVNNPTLVNLALSGAAEDADFTSSPDISGGTVTIPPGETSVLITLSPLEDGIEEPDEDFTLSLLSGSDYRRIAPFSAFGTVRGIGYLSVVANGSPAEHPPAAGQFTFQRAPERSSQAITASFSISGDASTGIDFTISGADSFDSATGSGTITLVSGQSEASLTLTPIDDTEAEGFETIIATLLEGSGYALSAQETAELKIADDEQIDSNTQQFTAGDPFDLANIRLTFVPLDNGFYRGHAESISEFEIDISTTGTSISLGDDSHQKISLSDDAKITFFGIDHSDFYVGSNGYVTFEASDSDRDESIQDHFDLPRVSLLFDDLRPSTSGEFVHWQQLDDRIIVQYSAIPEFGTSNTATFQLEFFFDGKIRLNYLLVGNRDAIVGLSPGSYDATTFLPTDLSELPSPPQPNEPIREWQERHFTPAEILAGMADMTSDSEVPPDGLINLIEYAMNLDPRVADAHLAALKTNQEKHEGAHIFKILVRRNPDATGLTISIQSMRPNISLNWENAPPLWEGDAGQADTDGTPLYEYHFAIDGQSFLCRIVFDL